MGGALSSSSETTAQLDCTANDAEQNDEQKECKDIQVKGTTSAMDELDDTVVSLEEKLTLQNERVLGCKGATGKTTETVTTDTAHLAKKPSFRRNDSLQAKLNGHGRHHKTRSVRVFVSSTFRDFALERDYLMRHTLPILRDICSEKGLTVVLVDLRWGVTEEESSRGDVVKLCLNEIDACFPFFVGLLGNRYGWHLTGDPEADESLLEKTMDIGQEEHPWVKEYRDKSVTELEILHGALLQPKSKVHAYFYLRQHEEYMRNEYDKLDPDLIKAKVFDAETDHAAKSQNQLREKVKTSGFPYIEYEEVATMCDQLVHDIREAIDKEWPGVVKITPSERVRLQHDSFAATRMMGYVASPAKFLELDNFVWKAKQDGVDTDIHRACYITSPAGHGKSSLIANWAEHHDRKFEAHLVISHYIGMSNESADYTHIVHRITEELNERLMLEEELPKDASLLVDQFDERLRFAAARVREEDPSGCIVITLDGLDQLDDQEQGRNLSWIPRRPCPGLVVIVSTNEGRSMDLVRKRGWPAINVPELEEHQRTSAIKTYLAAHAKKLDETQTELIVKHDHTKSPLYLRTLLDEARLFGNFFQLTEHLHSLLEAKSPTELFGRVILRMSEDCGFSLVNKVIAHVYCSRDGLMDDELLASMNPIPTPAVAGEGAQAVRVYDRVLTIPRQGPYTQLLHSLRQQLCSGGGMLSFFDRHVRTAVKTHCQNENLNLALDRLIEYWQRGENLQQTRKLRELPWLLQSRCRWEELAQHLANPHVFLEMVQESSSRADLKRYWAKYEQMTDSKKFCQDYVLESVDQYVKKFKSILSDPQALASVAASEFVGVQRGESKFQDEESKGDENEVVEKPTRPTPAITDVQVLESIARTFGAAAQVLEIMGQLHHALQLRREQLTYLEKVMAMDTNTENNETYETVLVTLLNELAVLYQETGEDYKESLKLKQRILEMDEVRLGPHHPKIAVALNNMASLDVLLGNLDRAKNLYERALKIQKKSAGVNLENQKNIATTLCNLATLCEARQDVEQAKQYLNEAMAIREQAFGSDHPLVARTAINLGAIEQHQGKTSEAQSKLEHGLEILEASLDPKHPDIAWALFTLASFHSSVGNYSKALPLYIRALDIRKARLGPLHIDVGATYLNMGSVLHEMWGAIEDDEDPEFEVAYRKAEENYVLALEIFKEKLGMEHPNTASAFHNLGTLYFEYNDLEAAEQNFEQALKIRRVKLGDSDPQTRNTISCLESCREAREEDAMDDD